MASLRAFLIPTAFFVATYPFAAFAAETNFFGPIIPQMGDKCYCPGTAMDWGCVLQVFQGVMNVLVSLGVLAVVFFIAWAGFLMITGGSNPANRTKAKNRLINAVIGLVVILGAWLVVDTVMKTLYNPDTTFNSAAGETKFGPWNAIFTGEEANNCLDKNDHPGGLTDGGLLGVVNPGTTDSTTGGNVPGGAVPGSFTYDPGIKAQVGQASGGLTTLLSCMAGKLPAGVGRISSISDSAIISGSKTFAQCEASGCSHMAGSCHYGGSKCTGRSFAVDFGDEQNASALRAAASSCGANYIGYEGTHLHVSVGKACGCN